MLLFVLSMSPVKATGQVVPDVDLSTLSPSVFTDDELDVPYYLAHFSRLANSVVMEGPSRGYIDIPVWRSEEENRPANSRIMENVLSLAFFYATDRPWNPYYNHPAVRTRLEAALRYWLDLQLDDGTFSRFGDDRGHLSPTAFATKFMGETLRLLHNGPPIDADLLDDFASAQRAAVIAVLSDDDAMYAHGRRFTNQFTNVWAGVGAYLEAYPDPEVGQLLEERFGAIVADFQSPAGYFYEHGGPDWTYDIETHHSNHRAAWHYFRDSDIGDVYADSMARWYNWLVYNAVLEPDGSGFTMNHPFETRLSFPFYRENRKTMYGETCAPVAEVVVMARAFCESVEGRAARLARERAALERTWPAVPPLEIGGFSAYSPYAFLHRDHIQWHPTAEQKAYARSLLPTFSPRSFTHMRADHRHIFADVFVHRGPYYAAFSAGEQITPQQRFGLGLVWQPGAGAVLQSHPGGGGGTWGTRAANASEVYESSIENTDFTLNGQVVRVQPRPRDYPPGTFSVTYNLANAGSKTITFLDSEIVVAISHAGAFVEQIPLLVVNSDDVRLGDSQLTLAGEPPFSISFAGADEVELVDTGIRSGPNRTVTAVLQARGRLTYRLRFAE